MPNWIDACAEAAEPTCSSTPLFHRWAALSAVAGALGNRCWYNMGGYEVVPSLVIILVGSPAVGKSIAFSLPYDQIFYELSTHLDSDPDSKETKHLYRIGWERYGLTFPLRLVLDKITQAKLAKIASECTNVITALRDIRFDSSFSMAVEEIQQFMSPNDMDIQAFVVKGWDGRKEYDQNTKTMGRHLIKGHCMNFLAATTPDLFVETMPKNAEKQGMMSRVIVVNYIGPDPKRHAGYESPNSAVLRYLRDDLADIAKLAGPFQMTDECWDFAEDWISSGEHPVPKSQALRFYNSRRYSNLIKMSMAISAAKSSSKIIDLEDFKDAQAMLFEAENTMGPILEKFGMSEVGKTFHDLVDMLKFECRKLPEGGMPMHRFQDWILERASAAYELKAYLEALQSSRKIRVSADGAKVYPYKKAPRGKQP